MLKKTCRLCRIVKAVVCTALILNLHVWAGGCGLNGVFTVDGKIRIALTPDQPLTQTLAGSQFEGATAIEIDPAVNRFTLIFPTADREISGQYSLVKREFAITQLRLARGALSTDLALNNSKQVTSIEVSTGQRWERPAEWTGLTNDVLANGVDAYLAANIELVDQTRQLDGGDGARLPTPTTDEEEPESPNNEIDKSGPAAQDATGGLGDVLAGLAVVFGLQLAASNFPAIFFVFQILVSTQTAMAIAGIAPGPGAPPTTDGGVAPTGTAILRVTNQLTDGKPIWFVTLIQDNNSGDSGGNLLGDESIPAGSSRDFPAPQGTRDINIIVPSGVDCFIIYANKGISLVDGRATELIITDESVGELFPQGCNNGG
ncbi:MAG: hypothetical protein MI923_09050 [Phycisphaerales bacterium]|nr:hypothetical protein [Phycisphaerales bacterium]